MELKGWRAVPVWVVGERVARLAEATVRACVLARLHGRAREEERGKKGSWEIASGASDVIMLNNDNRR